MTMNRDEMPPGFLWTGGIGFGSGFERARRLRLFRPLTPQQRFERDIRRGGFPLLRKEGCDPAPGKTLYGVLERITMSAPTGRINS